GVLGGRDVDVFFFFSSRRRHTRLVSDWSSDVCSSDLGLPSATSACVVERMKSPTEVLGVDTCSLPLSFRDPDADLQVSPGAQALPDRVHSRLSNYLIHRVGPQVAQTLRIREV